jgi:myo-inositol 2-dehydrogenase/D-chiro-inositol 1-dehydrogenase
VVNVGVIGTGMIGGDHVTRLASRISGTTVGAVYDLDTERATQVGKAVGAAVCARATDVIDDGDIDAVLIASPGDTHAELALACVAAGKPVLCEKPLATTAAAALRVVDAEVAADRRLIQVGFMRRYDKGYEAVKAAIDDGSIGVPLVAHCIHRNAGAPPGFTTDMAMTDSVVHEVDALRWLLGSEIVAATVIAGRSSPLAGEDVRDPQLVVFETAEGAIAEVESFVNCQYGYDVRCEIVGSIGAVALEDPTGHSLAAAGRRTRSVAPDWRVRFAAAYIDELQQWADSLEAGVAGGPSAWDGYAAAAVTEACVASQTTGSRTPVSLTARPALYS